MTCYSPVGYCDQTNCEITGYCAWPKDTVKLLNVYSTNEKSILYKLLGERTKDQSISHKEMPTMEQHIKFVDSCPYNYWYLIMVEDVVGSVYLTYQNEIGISVLKEHRGNGYATQAIKKLMEKHPCQFLANINPKNKASIKLFEKLGFKKLQVTYVKS